MSVSLLKLELLSGTGALDITEFYNGKWTDPCRNSPIDDSSSFADDTHCGTQRHELQNVCVLTDIRPLIHH